MPTKLPAAVNGGRANSLATPKSVSLMTRSIAGQHDVRRLQVAVDDAAVVGVLQGRDDLQGQVEHLRPRQPAPLAEDRLAIPAVDVLHRVEEQPVVAAGLEEMDDVGMVELPQGLDFALEPGDEDVVSGQVGVEHLDGDDGGRVVGPVGAIDTAHRPAADFGVDHPRSELPADHANPPGTSISDRRPISHRMGI